MSSDPVIPRTAVPAGIVDPVEKARAELKAALAAIEEKSNVPKRVSIATDRGIAKARAFAQERPLATAAIVVTKAVAIGALVWWGVRAYTRS